MSLYLEGDVPYVANGSNNGGFLGNDGIWGIIALALVFGWGRGGFGFGGGQGGYYGTPATQADLAAGFNNSAVLNSLNDLKLGQSSGFANVQQTLCQGFNGINTAILQSANATERGFATLGYNLATGINGISTQLSSCCCDLKGAIADVKYATEKQTQTILDYMQNEKINALTAENVALKGKLSDDYQADRIIGALAPKQPIPAYPVFPTTSFAYPSGVRFGVGNNCECGCTSIL